MGLRVAGQDGEAIVTPFDAPVLLARRAHDDLELLHVLNLR